MYIRQTISKQKGKIYTNYLLVESVSTEKGPRQRTICSLGSLKPRPKEEWLALARKVERALSGEPSLFPESDTEVASLVRKAQEYRRRKATPPSSPPDQCISVIPDRVELRSARSAGAVHVGWCLAQRLGLPDILAECGFSPAEQLLTLALILNRLIAPGSEHATPDWLRSTAFSDILATDISLSDDTLYRHLDRLYPIRGAMEKALSERERTLFNLDQSIFLYDLTSTYFEGGMAHNPLAKRGYSRDQRPDCQQVVVGLVLSRDGFPLAHEVFPGNTADTATVEAMLTILTIWVGCSRNATVIVDRGMASEENLSLIKRQGLHYCVAGRQGERLAFLSDFEEEDGWQELYREGKSRVWVKRMEKDQITSILCLSEGRMEKDRAIREREEGHFRQDLDRLRKRITEGRLLRPSLIHQAIGRIKERYPRVARYYSVTYEEKDHALTVSEKTEARSRAEELDGGYLLKTDRTDLSGEEIWRMYTLLTRVESAFRDMKSPLSERPIFHQLPHRTETHIFLCVLAYHLLITIEHTLREHGDHRSWETIRNILSTHQVVTVVLPTSDGGELHIRRGVKPEEKHRDIYQKLHIPEEPMKPRKVFFSRTDIP